MTIPTGSGPGKNVHRPDLALDSATAPSASISTSRFENLGRLAAEALLPRPGEVELAKIFDKLVSLIGESDLGSTLENRLAGISPALVGFSSVIEGIQAARESMKYDRIIRSDGVKDILSEGVLQKLASGSATDGSYQVVAAKHLQTLLSPFRGCDARLERVWTFPDGLQGGPYIVFSHKAVDFGLVRMSYGVFSRSDHEIDHKLNRFVHPSERSVIKTVFGEAEPSEKNLRGIIDHPLVVIGTVQGIKGVNLEEADIGIGPARKFMLEAVASSFQELQRARWVIGISPGGSPKHLGQFSERDAFNYRLLDPLFEREIYHSSEVYFPRGDIQGVTKAGFYPLKELTHNKTLQRLYRERASDGKTS